MASPPSKQGAFNSSAVHSLAQEVPHLTPEEISTLENVMKKAQEFEAEENAKLRQPVEGQLSKYTNVMRGWQFRWFILVPETGMLEYYMLDEKRKTRPRGALNLMDAIILPGEDHHSFTVSGACGEIYKLRATSAEEKHFWIDRIRSTIEFLLTNTPEKSMFSKDVYLSNIPPGSPIRNSSFHSSEVLHRESQNAILVNSLCEIKDAVAKSAMCQIDLAKSIESLPYTDAQIKCSDKDLLLLKATSNATLQSLEQCYLILRHKHREILQPSGLPYGAPVNWLDKFQSPVVVRRETKKLAAIPRST